MVRAFGNTADIVKAIRPEDKRTFIEIEALHRAQLAAGALAHMPLGFLARFYSYLAGRPDSVVLTVEKQGRVAGFVAGTLHASGLLRSFLVAEPTTFLTYGLSLLLKPRLLSRVLSLMLHSAVRGKREGVDDCQLLSIAVVPDCGRSGVGTVLFGAICDWFRQRGADQFEIVAAKTQLAALSFYVRRGAAKVGETNLGGLNSVLFRHIIRPEGTAGDRNANILRPPEAER